MPITTANAPTIQLVRTLEIPGFTMGQISQCSLDFSPDGRLLVGACGRNRVPVWDVESGGMLRSLSDSSTQNVACAFSPDGATIALGGFDQAVTLWETDTGRETGSRLAHTAPVWDVAFDPTDGSLVSCSLGLLGGTGDQGGVRRWGRGEVEPVWVSPGSGNCLSVAVGASGDEVAFGSIGGTVGVLSAADGTVIAELEDTSHNTGDVAFSPSGGLLAAGSDDDLVYLWDASNGYQVSGRLEGHTGYVNGVAFSPDEALLVSGSQDGTVGVWDLKERTLITLLRGHEGDVLRLTFNPDGTLIASISWDGTVRLWGVTAGR